jgi:hypothetical protein
MTRLIVMLLGLAAVLSLVAHDVAMAIDSPLTYSAGVAVRSTEAHDHAPHVIHGDLPLLAELEARTCGSSEAAPPPALAGFDSGSLVVPALWSCDGLQYRGPVSSHAAPTSSPGVRRAFLQVYLN